MNLPSKIYTEQDLTRARRTSKMIGWAQGAGIVIAGGIVLNLLGWIPTVVVVGGIGYIAYRLLTRSSGDADEGV